MAPGGGRFSPPSLARVALVIAPMDIHLKNPPGRDIGANVFHESQITSQIYDSQVTFPPGHTNDTPKAPDIPFPRNVRRF
jgi:hypothetical protein